MKPAGNGRDPGIAVASSPRMLVALLGGSGNVAAEAGITSAGVRQWGRRGRVPFASLVKLRPAMARRGVGYDGPTTPGLAEAAR
jgi:hypothetical protein